MFIDYTESPYFYTMPDIITDYEPIFITDNPAVEQNNRWSMWFKKDPKPTTTLFTQDVMARVRRKRIKDGYYETF